MTYMYRRCRSASCARRELRMRARTRPLRWARSSLHMASCKRMPSSVRAGKACGGATRDVALHCQARLVRGRMLKSDHVRAFDAASDRRIRGPAHLYRNATRISSTKRGAPFSFVVCQTIRPTTTSPASADSLQRVSKYL